MKQNEAGLVILRARYFLYMMFQVFYGNEPTKEILDYLNSDLAKESLSYFVPRGLGDNLERFVEKYQNNTDSILKVVLAEYTNNFIGPGSLIAPPWESVYVTQERLLFQESTLMVRRQYLKYNLLPAEYPHVADDHISLELDFMANLAGLIEDAYSKNDYRKMLDCLVTSKDFIRKHLLVWIPLYIVELNKAKTQFLYYDLSLLLVKFINVDIIMLTEIEDMVKGEQ